MNSRLLKAKRVEQNKRQLDIAELLEITPKSACEKENSDRCRYTVDEMIKVAKCLELTMEEFDAIFFDNRLTKCNIIR